jgi:enamine deaminase RidA (YjgF/YER057c/UK114 family)
MRSTWQFGLPEERSFGFAQAVGAGGLVHVSGQIGADGDERPDDMQGQMRVAYRRIAHLLEQAGATVGDVVDETVFVTDMAAASRAARVVRREVYGDEPRVASTMVGVSVIGHPRAEPPLLVEIKCTAVGGVGGA